MKKLFYLFVFIVTTVQATAQWQNLGSGIDSLPRSIFHISAVNKNVVWAVTFEPSFTNTFEYTRTTNGGQTWKAGLINDSIGNFTPVVIHALDSLTAWIPMVALPNQDLIRLYKTSNGGNTWVEQKGEFNQSGFGFACIHFFNATEGICFGSPGTGNNSIDTLRVYRTIDGGTNWSRVLLPALLGNEGQWAYGNNRYANFNDTLWFVTRNSRVFRTTDKGLTWQAYATGLTGSDGLASVAFQNSMQGIVTMSSPKKAARTTDGGATWTAITPPLYVPFGDIAHIPGTKQTYVMNEGFLNAGASSKFMITKDGGDTWDSVSYSPSVPVVQFLSPTVGFGGGKIVSATQGGVYKWTGDLSDSVATAIGEVEAAINFQLMPNPASALVSVETSYNQKGGTITITNQTGALVFEKEITAEKEIISVANFAKGMYLVNVINASQKTTRKLLVE